MRERGGNRLYALRKVFSRICLRTYPHPPTCHSDDGPGEAHGPQLPHSGGPVHHRHLAVQEYHVERLSPLQGLSHKPADTQAGRQVGIGSNNDKAPHIKHDIQYSVELCSRRCLYREGVIQQFEFPIGWSEVTLIRYKESE